MKRHQATTFENATYYGALFTQLLRNEKPFGHQFAKFSYHLSKYEYFAELFTNVKLRAEQIIPFVRSLSSTFRKIINADVRYRQRLNDLPCAVGCRAFGVANLGGGWYSPNIKVACSNAKVLEYICRQWCKRTNQYPHTLQIEFENLKTAKRAMPRFADNYDYAKTDNVSITRHANIIVEDYYISQPFRLELYAVRVGFCSAVFGAACRILKTALCQFDSHSINLNDEKYCIADCYDIDGLRAVQTWGYLNSQDKAKNEKLPTIKHSRKFYGGNTDKMASTYYRACRAGYLTFNAYIYGRLKAGASMPYYRDDSRPVEVEQPKKRMTLAEALRNETAEDKTKLQQMAAEREKRCKCKPKTLRMSAK